MEFLGLFAASYLLCAPAWYVGRKHGWWSGWDYAAVLGPVPFWLFLTIARVGSHSMSNIIELVVVAAFVPFAISIRAFVLPRFRGEPGRSSLIVCGVCFLAPLVLRLAIPGLPE